MRLLLFLSMLCPLFAWAQERDSRPLPMFDPLPYAEMRDSVKGWMFSLDGQWMSQEKTIPVRGVSRNSNFFEKNENVLGSDNFETLQAYRVRYGKDTLICFVKLFWQGRYKYPTRKRGWMEFLNAYYIIVRYRDLEPVRNFTSEETAVIRIEALDGGQINDVKEDEVLQEVRSRVIIQPDYDRNLVITAQYVDYNRKMRFQICSLHDIFPDVEGVRNDFTKRGRTVYGSTALFDYLYYESDYYHFENFFELPLPTGELIDP